MAASLLTEYSNHEYSLNHSGLEDRALPEKYVIGNVMSTGCLGDDVDDAISSIESYRDYYWR